MGAAATMVGFGIAALGVLAVLSPGRVLSLIEWETGRGLHAAAAIRVGIGIVLLLSAESSRAPLAFQLIGAVALVGGIASPLLPRASWAGLVRWWSGRPHWLYRGAGVVAALFGGFVAVAAWPGGGA